MGGGRREGLTPAEAFLVRACHTAQQARDLICALADALLRTLPPARGMLLTAVFRAMPRRPQGSAASLGGGNRQEALFERRAAIFRELQQAKADVEAEHRRLMDRKNRSLAARKN